MFIDLGNGWVNRYNSDTQTCTWENGVWGRLWGVWDGDSRGNGGGVRMSFYAIDELYRGSGPPDSSI